MGKPENCQCENKGADHRLSFRYIYIYQFIFLLNAKFQASSPILRLHRPVCVRPSRKPRSDRFSRVAAQIKIRDPGTLAHTF